MTFLHRKFCTVSVHNEWSERAVLTGLGRGFEEEQDDFHLPAQRNCAECVPQVVETGVAQKCISGIYYKANTQYKFKATLLI